MRQEYLRVHNVNVSSSSMLHVGAQSQSRYRHLETQRNDLQREYLLFRLHSSALTTARFTTMQHMTPPEVSGLCAQLDSAAETRDAALKEREEMH